MQVRVLGVDHGDHAVEEASVSEIFLGVERLDDWRRVGKARGLNHDVVEPVPPVAEEGKTKRKGVLSLIWKASHPSGKPHILVVDKLLAMMRYGGLQGRTLS